MFSTFPFLMPLFSLWQQCCNLCTPQVAHTHTHLPSWNFSQVTNNNNNNTN